MFFAPSGMQKLGKKPRPLRILFDLIFLRTGSEFLSPSLPHHSADSGIVPDCLAELLNPPPPTSLRDVLSPWALAGSGVCETGCELSHTC